MDIDKLSKKLQEKVASLEKQRQREAEEFEVLNKRSLTKRPLGRRSIGRRSK